MFGGNGAQTGMGMLLKSMGFDVGAVMENVESARSKANEVMTHFDHRLTAIETQMAQMNKELQELTAWLKTKQQ